MVRGGRHRGGRLLSFAVVLVSPGAGFHGRLDPPSGEEARLGQDQEEVRRTWLEQPGGGAALNPGSPLLCGHVLGGRASCTMHGGLIGIFKAATTRGPSENRDQPRSPNLGLPPCLTRQLPPS